MGLSTSPGFARTAPLGEPVTGQYSSIIRVCEPQGPDGRRAGMTVLRAGDAGRSDGEAMSTGSDLSEEGSDVVFSNGGPSSVDLPGSYDAPLSEILRLHRALAHSYTGPSKQSRRLIKNRPRAYSADFGCLRTLDTFHPPLSGYSPEPTTPTSPTPSDTSSTTSSGTPCGTPKSKTLKFNLATISENLGMLRGPERHENGASTLPRRVRSNSTPLIRPATTYPSDDEDSDDDSDDDNDDYGFLSQYSRMFVTPPNCSGVPTGMHKSKSPTTARRLLPKRWRKPRWASSKTQQVLWTPEVSWVLKIAFLSCSCNSMHIVLARGMLVYGSIIYKYNLHVHYNIEGLVGIICDLVFYVL